MFEIYKDAQTKQVLAHNHKYEEFKTTKSISERPDVIDLWKILYEIKLIDYIDIRANTHGIWSETHGIWSEKGLCTKGCLCVNSSLSMWSTLGRGPCS